jgi:hypothetical protein
MRRIIFVTRTKHLYAMIFFMKLIYVCMRFLFSWQLTIFSSYLYDIYFLFDQYMLTVFLRVQ